MRRLLLLAVCLLPVTSVAAPPDVTDIVFTQRPGHALPQAAAFVDADGRAVTLGSLVQGRPAVLALGYYACPALCGLVREQLFTALGQTGMVADVDYTLVFVSIDPAEQPADARRALAGDLRDDPAPGASAGWHFLTGTQPAITAVEDAVGYTERYDASLKQFIHPAGVVMITPGGLVSGYVLGLDYRPGDLRSGLLQAGKGGIAKAALPVLLLCFHYDATTGRYTLAVVKLLRIAAGLTIAGILALLVVLKRRSRIA